MRETLIELPELMPHGGYVRAEYRGGAWGVSTDSARPEGGVTGVVRRFRKDCQAAETPQAYGWIKAIYPQAIEYSGTKQDVEGMIFAAAFLMLVTGGVGICGLYILFAFKPTVISIIVALLMTAAGTLVSIWIFLFPLRQVWRVPRDLPIIFDRANRKVYRILRDIQPGLKGLFERWPVMAASYDWDLLDAEYNVRTISTSATVYQTHRLVFVVRKSAEDPTIIDHIEIGNGMSQAEGMVEPMWEHIRRFMEENGPSLPAPSEPLDSRSDEKPTWWRACGQAGPWGNRYLWWWKNQIVLSVMHHAIVGLGMFLFLTGMVYGKGDLIERILKSSMGHLVTWCSITLNWGQGTGIWLIAHTARIYDWPRAVKDAVGTTLRRGKGW